MRRHAPYGVALILALCSGLVFVPAARGEWRYSGAVRASLGKYVSTSTVRNYYFTHGLLYEHGRWDLAANVSLAARQGDDLVAVGGGMMSGQGDHDVTKVGLGDLFVRAEYTLLRQRSGWPDVTLGALTKAPTASVSSGLGTGEWDGGVSLSLARFARSVYFSTEVGHLWLGDPPGATYRNPVTYAAGVGRAFANGRLGMLLLYSGTSMVFADYDAPRQAGIGLNWRLSNRLGAFTNVVKGVSETVPDFGLSLGVNTTL